VKNAKYKLKNRNLNKGVYNMIRPNFEKQGGLVPVIAQDYQTGEVLMLAYMNEEAFNKTLETGKVHYFSRSRNKLWLKGEQSGHFQILKEMFIDCDEDAILVKIEQVGGIACHTGNRSCFYRKLV
jgi:phosphoribosyl-AMP cyclohydrolase